MHEMSNTIFLGKTNVIHLSSAEFTQSLLIVKLNKMAPGDYPLWTKVM